MNKLIELWITTPEISLELGHVLVPNKQATMHHLLLLIYKFQD
jgi:hypothetical protein